MDSKRIEHFRDMLVKQGERAEDIINTMVKNREAEQEDNYPTELSNYDNHPADTGSQLYELEHNLALKVHQEYMLQEVRKALQRIEDGSYGVCTFCGKDIGEERLEALPTAGLCKACEDERMEHVGLMWDKVPNESRQLDVKKVFNEWDDLNFEGMDQMNDVMKHGSSSTPQDIAYRNYFEEFYTNETDEQGVVDPMDKISNEEYKKQLPD